MKNIEEIEKFYKTIGKNVKRKREENQLTQLQLSHLMGFKSVSLVSQAETFYNKQHFSLKHLYMLASIFKCNLEEFFKNVKIISLDWEI